MNIEHLLCDKFKAFYVQFRMNEAQKKKKKQNKKKIDSIKNQESFHLIQLKIAFFSSLSLDFSLLLLLFFCAISVSMMYVGPFTFHSQCAGLMPVAYTIFYMNGKALNSSAFDSFNFPIGCGTDRNETDYLFI